MVRAVVQMTIKWLSDTLASVWMLARGASECFCEVKFTANARFKYFIYCNFRHTSKMLQIWKKKHSKWVNFLNISFEKYSCINLDCGRPKPIPNDMSSACTPQCLEFPLCLSLLRIYQRYRIFVKSALLAALLGFDFGVLYLLFCSFCFSIGGGGGQERQTVWRVILVHSVMEWKSARADYFGGQKWIHHIRKGTHFKRSVHSLCETIVVRLK